MVFHTNQQGKLFKKSMLAMCVMAFSAPTFAQNAAKATDKKSTTDVEEVVVTGMKEALGSAQEIKKNADTVVDSITAKDLGSFPDKSVAEALQRVAGVTVNRFAASADTAHFSAEPSGVIVRGLNQVRTEFNGRDSFSANSARGLSWGDISPELMSGVDTYKNQTAELIEGGIAGSVNMRTRVPFDQSGDMYALTLNANYGDLSQKYTPEVSGLASTRWETGVGEFGALGNLAYSNVNTRSQGVQFGRMNRYASGVFGAGEHFIPDSINFRDNTYDRTRKGASVAFQWQDSDSKYLVTLQANRSEYHNSWEEYVISENLGNVSFSQSVFWDITDPKQVPKAAPGTDPFTFDSKGYFQNGTLTNREGWWADGQVLKNDQNKLFFSCYDWSCGDAQEQWIGDYLTTTTRANDNKNLTQDIALNFKWNPTDTLHATFDVQRVSSSIQNYDISTDFNTFTTPTVDLTGSLPSVYLGSPTKIALSSGGYANAHNYYLNDIMDHVEDSSGHELAARADLKIDIDSGWVDSVKIGARYADREQSVNWSQYNWQNVTNGWTSAPASFFLDSKTPSGAFKGYPDFYVTKNWDSNYGTLASSDPSRAFVFADMNLLKNQKAWAKAMSNAGLGATAGGWDPVCSNVGDRSLEVPGTCFTPAESVDISEKTDAFYAQLNFGGEHLSLLDKPISGNIGVRYVETTDISSGGEAFPKVDPTNTVCKPNAPAIPGQPVDVPFTLGCYLSAADIAFMNGGSITGTTEVKHRNILPSFNVKWELSDEWLVRFAASRAMSRPDIGNLRNYIGLSATLPSQSSSADALWIKDSSGTITGANVKYKADAQNPFLKPVLADQIDLSVEYYFAKVGSLTMTLFEKQFSDYIQFGTYYRDVTNNGVTRQVEVRGPLNGNGARLNGFELAFQRFFDFLPQPFDGLGIQTNYTYIHNAGITNTNVTNVSASASTIQGQAPDAIKVNRLEGLSDHSANFVLMYEKDDWTARMAYSWRSEYMITALDCCVAVPIWNKATGQLDGSVKYKYNDNIEIAFQASNLLNEKTTLSSQLTDSDKGAFRLPNASFQNDRRYTLGLRLKY